PAVALFFLNGADFHRVTGPGRRAGSRQRLFRCDSLGGGRWLVEVPVAVNAVPSGGQVHVVLAAVRASIHGGGLLLRPLTRVARSPAGRVGASAYCGCPAHRPQATTRRAPTPSRPAPPPPNAARSG